MRHRLIGLACGVTFAMAGSTGFAAQVTERLPFLHVDGEIGYEGTFLFGTLREQGERVGRFTRSHHQLNVDLEFGAAPRTEVYLRLPIVLLDQLDYGQANEMTYDPDSGVATMLGGDALEGDDLLDRQRAGFGDMWIGVQVTPSSETPEKRWNVRPAAATVLLDLGVKLPTGKTLFDEPGDGGKLGPGSGAADVRFGAAFSKRIGNVDPYIAVRYLVTGATEADLVDGSGNVAIEGASIDPADELDVAVGAEILALESRETRRRVSVDVGLGWTYFTWATQPAGYWLPSQLDATAGLISSESEYMAARLGFGLYFQPVPVVQLRLDAAFVYPFSHVLERVDEQNYVAVSGYDSAQLRIGFVGAARF